MDFDNDGKNDIVAGDSEGAVSFFKNIGTKSKPELAEAVMVEAGGKPIFATKRIYGMKDGKRQVTKVIAGSSELADSYSKLHLADWNGDGLRDLLMGHSRKEILLYLNFGTAAAPEFGQPGLIKPAEGSFPSRPSPLVIDWDKDGLNDLLVGSDDGKIYFFPNRGSKENPRLVADGPLEAGGKVIREGSRARITVTDWNNDGKPDILLGDFYSGSPGEGGQRSMGGNIWLYLQK